eukprot:6256509-Prorocentrum_lima.AAC.1
MDTQVQQAPLDAQDLGPVASTEWDVLPEHGMEAPSVEQQAESFFSTTEEETDYDWWGPGWSGWGESYHWNDRWYY